MFLNTSIKNLTFLIVTLFISIEPALAQVKVGDNPQNINEVSLLELESASKVLVITRLSEVEMQALTPLTGAIVYNTDEDCVFYFNGNEWDSLCQDGDSGGNGGDGSEDENNETITTMVPNDDGTYTYTNEAGEETVLSFDFTSEQGGNPNLMGEPGSIFFAGNNSNATEDNANLKFDQDNGRLGIGTPQPNATLTVLGSVATEIQFLSGDTVALTDINHTVIVTNNSTLFLPAATPSKGMMFIVKIAPFIPDTTNYPTVTVPGGYYDSDSVWRQAIPAGEHVVWFQSNGFLWEQVN